MFVNQPLICVTIFIFLNGVLVDSESKAKVRFNKFLIDINDSLYKELYSSEIDLLDWSYGNVLGTMLQASYVFRELGTEMENYRLSVSDLASISDRIDIFESGYRYRSNFTHYIKKYSVLEELRTALEDMEKTFSYNFAYQLIKRGQTDMSYSVHTFKQYWNKLDLSRDGMVKFLKLVNKTIIAEDVIDMWRSQSLCDPQIIRHVFFHIQTNILRYFISREVCRGMKEVKCIRGTENLEEKIIEINLRMMRVLTYCWKKQMIRKARRDYAAYYKARFGSSERLHCQRVNSVLFPGVVVVLVRAFHGRV